MSGVSMSTEFEALDAAFGIGLGEMEWMTINASRARSSRSTSGCA